MTLTFQEQFNQELLRSERKRSLIIISIFAFAFCYRAIAAYFFSNDEELLRIQSFSLIWLFPLIVIAFELTSLLYITKRLRTDRKKIPMYMQVINTLFEISLPALLMLAVLKEYPGYDVLKSPAAYTYFLFIILSTLRLNLLLSVMAGVLAAASYYAISFFAYNHFGANDAARAIVILLSGVAAGMVAKQIRNGINNSLQEAEKMLENDGQMESKRMHVAVMFIDIRDFTRFAAGRSPEEIVKYQNAFFTRVVDAVTRHGGIVNQFLGDGCMTTFGAPASLENPSQHAVNAALELLEQLENDMNEKRIIPTRVGIGIHAGEAVTGNIGNADRQQYSITGSVVIMASRIEQLNKQFNSQILISEEVAARINNKVTADLYNHVELKGFDRPVAIYKVA